MARRAQPDPLLMQTVRERLARLLAEEESQHATTAAVPAATISPTAPADELPEPRRFGRAHLAVVAVVLALGLVVAGWSLLRARPVALAAAPDPPPAVVTGTAPPAATGSPSPSPSPSAGGASGATAMLVVHVVGAVRRPGLVELPSPARVQDAVDAAGGFTRAADPGELNLAQLLADGQQVVIGTRDEPDGEVRGGGAGSGSSGGAGTTGPSGAGGGAGAVLDLNAADAGQLESLPGIGPVTATKIVAWREQHGRFSRVEELQEVDGIGPKTYAEIAPHVRV